MSLNNFKMKVKQYGIINNEAGSGMAMVRGVKWKEFSEELTFKLRFEQQEGISHGKFQEKSIKE